MEVVSKISVNKRQIDHSHQHITITRVIRQIRYAISASEGKGGASNFISQYREHDGFENILYVVKEILFKIAKKKLSTRCTLFSVLMLFYFVNK